MHTISATTMINTYVSFIYFFQNIFKADAYKSTSNSETFCKNCRPRKLI